MQEGRENHGIERLHGHEKGVWDAGREFARVTPAPAAVAGGSRPFSAAE